MRELNPWERLIDQGGISGHGISNIYGILSSPLGSESLGPLESWKTELNKLIPEQMKGKTLDYVHSTSTDVKVKEINYKLLIKWYYVPVKLHRINQETSPLCWRECRMEGTHAHIWWHCPLIQSFCRKILKMIEKISGAEVKQDPWWCLFHTTGDWEMGGVCKVEGV